jgi:hypothetical protein
MEYKSGGAVACEFLSSEGKCSIWFNRPVGCALFPLAIQKTLNGYSIILKYHRVCGWHKDGKILFYQNKNAGFGHPDGSPLYIALKDSLIHLFGYDIYELIEKNIMKGDVKVPVNEDYLKILVKAKQFRELDKSIRVESPGVIRVNQKLIMIKMGTLGR